ncbi:MAG: hypothetical protein JWN20_1922, partial [Jatrophihabitantaceae bacterium]|nr:hypothetical protein [Jatrophihabitantaceae bacterium]
TYLGPTGAKPKATLTWAATHKDPSTAQRRPAQKGRTACARSGYD